MPEWGKVAKAFAPMAVRYGGCAAAVAVGGPAALAVAGLASRLFAGGKDADDNLLMEGSVGFGQAFAANVNGLITNLASDRMKTDRSGSAELEIAFRQALEESLEQVRPTVLEEAPAQGDWFENWDRRFQADQTKRLSALAGVSEAELLDLFEEGADAEAALWPCAQRLLVGLDAEARRTGAEITLRARAMAPEFAEVLRQRLTAEDCLPRLLGRHLEQHDAAWRRVLLARTEQVHQSVTAIEGFPEITQRLSAEMEALSRQMSALSGDLDLTRAEIGELRRELAEFGRTNSVTQKGAPAAVEDRPVQPRTNLPADTSKFVGRASEAERVRRLIRENRLTTLAGTGGAGKTRLAIEAARGVLDEFPDEFPDGVWLVELASKVDPDVVPGALAETLGLREQANAPPTVALRSHLRDKALLVVLDNCEHLHAACAAVADELLKHCAHMKIVATTREVLKTEVQESVHWVGALALPEGGAAASFEAVQASDAARLFALRAGEASRFKVTPENASAVATICTRLGGIPLALEIAAAHLQTLEPQELAEYLDEALELLVDDRRRERKEHMSVRETIRWSYDLLTDEQKRMMRRISVFEGSLTSDRVRAVCTPEWGKLKALRCLDKLVEKSMIQVKSRRDGQERRLYLLETVQQFGVDELAATGELDELELRHAEYFLELTEGMRDQLEEAPNEEMLGALAEAHDDVRVAMQRLTERRDAGRAKRLGAAFWRYWEIRGLLAEGRRILAKLLVIPASNDDRDAHSRVLSGAGLLAFRQGDIVEAGRRFREALTMEEARSETDHARLANCLNDVGLASIREGAIEEAVEYYLRYLELAETYLGKRDVAVANNNLGSAALAVGMLDEAETRLTLSRDLFAAIGNESDVAYPLTYLGALHVLRGDPQTATVHLEQALVWRERLGNPRGMAEAYHWLSRAAMTAGDRARAVETAARGMTYARQVEGSRETADHLDQMALLAVAEEAWERSLTLAAASDALRDRSSLPRLPVLQPELDQALARACEHTSADQQSAARALGAGGALKEIVERYGYA